MASCNVCGKTTNPPPGEPYDATVCDGRCARTYAKKTRKRVTLAALVTPVLMLASAGVASADEPGLWACTAEERVQMGIPDGDCYRTGAQLDREGWVEVADEEEFGDYVQESVAPSWAGGSSGVRRDGNGLACFCGGGQF